MNRPCASSWVVVGIAACLLLGAAQTASAQGSDRDPFVGTWTLNPALSWQFRGEQNKYEIISISVEDGVQTYRVRSMGARSTVDSHSGYSVKFNDDEWVHYQNYIPGNFRDQELLTVWVDDRTHYRIARTKSTGEARYILMRRMEEDLQSYSATLLTVDGEITLIRVFERCDEPCEPPAEYLAQQ